MALDVLIKVLGFSDSERNALKTVCRLSQEREVSYAIWSADSPSLPNLGIFDVDSYQAGLDMASPDFNPKLKLICIGENPPEHAWRSFQRPIPWWEVIAAMDQLFTSPQPLDIDTRFDEDTKLETPIGYKACLLISPHLDERFYLRARMALAGLVEVDECTNATDGLVLALDRQYDLVLASLEVTDMDPWEMVAQFQANELANDNLVLLSPDPSSKLRQRAEGQGCSGVLVSPFSPADVIEILAKI